MNTDVNVSRDQLSSVSTVKNTMLNGWVKMGNIIAQTDRAVLSISSDPFKKYNSRLAIRDQKSWVRW
jgi:lambda repressor-like predicted transcriptional regulator